MKTINSTQQFNAIASGVMAITFKVIDLEIIDLRAESSVNRASALGSGQVQLRDQQNKPNKQNWVKTKPIDWQID